MNRLFLVVCLMGLIGCDSVETPKLPETVPFNGKVTLDGQPLTDAMVKFTPATPAGGAEALGRTDSTGAYELKVVVGSASQAGAVPGDYKVHITTFLPPLPTKKGGAPPPAVAMEKVPQQFSSRETTPLRVKVPDGGGTKDFDLKSK